MRPEDVSITHAQFATRIEFVIKRDGSIVFIHDKRAADFLSCLGQPITRRVSHIEPVGVLLRWAFHEIRSRVSDESRLAGWTRTWRCTWRARIFNGPTIQPFINRRAAIDAEVKWLRENRI